MEVFDNKFGDDLKSELKVEDMCNIASVLFSMYGFNELKEQLYKMEEFRFIFTNPAFIKNVNNYRWKHL